MIDPINPDIEYEYFLAPSPSETAGRYRRGTFYLYARWDEWDFTLCFHPTIAAEDIGELGDYDLDKVKDTPERIAAFKESFHRKGKVGKPNEYRGSYLSKEEKMSIVRNMIEEYEGFEGVKSDRRPAGGPGNQQLR